MKAGHPPGDAAPTGHASQRGQCWAPTPAHPRPQHGGSGPPQPARRASSRGRGNARLRTRLTKEESTPPGDVLPPPPQRATLAYKGARCEAGAGSPRPRQPHPGHTGRGTPAARPRGRAARGGTAPDSRRPSQLWQATPPPRGRPPTTPAARSPHRASKPSGQCWAPTTAHPRPQHVDSGPLAAPRRGAARRGRAPGLGRPLHRGHPCYTDGRGEHPMPTRTRERWPAEPAFELPNRRPAAPTAGTPATGNARTTPCSPAQRHNNGGTRGPTQNSPSISDAGRGTRGHQGARTQRRRRRPPVGGLGRRLRPGDNPRALRGQHSRGTCASGGQRARPLPRVETGPLHRRRLVLQATPPTRPR